MPNELPAADLRRALPLVFKHDPGLPIAAHREQIAEALGRHQVLIVAGDTGSGKSTQLPQICLEIGRGVDGLIAHTQPRRLAARALATRIADELQQPLGVGVGFRVRFADQVSAATRLVVMTDGLLLAELSTDSRLSRYDTIIVDEAHERTLNIDLLLGVLHRLLPRRPELKLIVTSATLDVERIAGFFGDAPVVTVSGRSHPIEVRYAAEAPDAEDPDLPLAVLKAYEDIAATPGFMKGDVLVFLPGEREIRDVGEFLERELGTQVEVLELYSRLSWEQQSRIFQRGARRRIVVATNVAETSITVPGIRAVIDSGLARVSRYSPRNRLQRLPIEPVSRAGAEQRKGRCGRLGPGLCWRLYTQQDFEARPLFTEPEVLRTNLAALLLRMAADGLGAAEVFPFIDAPDARALGDGYRLLQELEAFDAERRITRRGRAMARLPLDPRLARALLESKRFRAEGELLAVVSGLSVPDARLAPAGAAGEDAVAAPGFDDPKSEFSALVKLWRSYRAARQRSRKELKLWCKERSLSLLRLSEWDDVYAQVADRAGELGIAAQRKPASYTGVHRSLLAGFCTMVGVRGEDGVYAGTRGVHFHIFPGSALKRRRPRWVMAANIVETSRVFARHVAEIEPMWIEAAARHLLKREFLEPDWDETREAVVARERVGFLGLILSADRVVNFGPIAPEESRRIFAREALVYQRLKRRPDWLQANDAALRAAQRIEERLRSRDLVHGPEVFVDFYDKALPRQVSSAATLDYFTRHLDAAQRSALTLGPGDIYARAPDPEALARFPEQAALAGTALHVAVDYRFAPGESGDGAVLQVPLLALPTVTRAALDAAIPGYAAPRIEALLRSLPKEARRGLIPIAGTAADFVASVGAAGATAPRLAEWLGAHRGVPSHLIRFDQAAVPVFLMPRIAVLSPDARDPGGPPTRELAHGDDVGGLRRRFAAAARAELDRLGRLAHPDEWRRFESDLDPQTLVEAGTGVTTVYAGLTRRKQAVEVRFEWTPAEARFRSRQGAAWLARLVLERQARDLQKYIAADAPFMLAASRYLRGAACTDLLLQQVFWQACFQDADPPHTRSAFDAAVQSGRERLHERCEELMTAARTWFAIARDVRRLLDDPRARRLAAQAEESAEHLRRLLAYDTFAAAPPDWLRQLPRYLKAEERRWQRLLARGSEPPSILHELTAWTSRAAALRGQVAAELRWLPQLDELTLWIEEYRVSLYAQDLRTQGPVSAVRLEVRAAEIEAWITR